MTSTLPTADADRVDIAVVGLAGRFPGAPDIETYWHNLCSGVESIRPLSREQLLAEGLDPELIAGADYVAVAPTLEGIELFDAGFFGFTAREAALLDPQQRLFLETAWHAMEHAGIDPAHCGTAGVFAGANLPGYLLSNLLGGQRFVLDAAMFELQIHNDKDYLASRTAHALGLTGPAISVQTACSTSLVAVHEAAAALRAGTCELALAGGVCVRVPHHVGYRYEPGLIYSPDGHCRPFDAEAAGTVFGNGVGVVVLKRLADARRDNDRILAVLKGSAVNNDGRDKVGYTAPSVRGQEAVVADAITASGISARTISAVEAHGTGTHVGDPIEIAALTRAFSRSTADTQFCAVSSVKANIGHLESAAGIAGFIKAVLQLHHRTLVPSLHFERPNPRIHFAATPFFVNTGLRPWDTGEDPRRIGVSSFGIGGTNAHVVLEQAPEPPAAPACDRPQLVVLSAATPAALDDTTARIAARLTDLDPTPLVDIAHTLQSGRAPLRFRRAVLARDTAEAAALLAGADPGRLRSADAGTAGAKVVFLFPGQGAQYPGMGRELYAGEPEFARAIDDCADLFRDHLGFDLREVLYPDDPTTDGLTRTTLAQPALFATEYAMARLLLSWGVEPDTMVGHSIGEFVAACLAGVLSLADATWLVAVRGKLMQELPGGAMISIAAGAERTRPRLPAEVSLAAINAPELCVASGPHDAIDRLSQELTADGIAVRPLHTSHAFHSAMMDPIVEPFTRVVTEATLSAPVRSVVSCVTGEPLDAATATDPGYWGAHMRRPVRFADAIVTAIGDRPAVLVEVGPGNTLSTLARACGGPESPRAAAVTTMRRPDEAVDDTHVVRTAVGDVWLFGGEVDWSAVHGTRRPRVDLPRYPFQRDRYWIEPRRASEPAPGDIAAGFAATSEPVAEPSIRSTRPSTLLTGYVEPADELEVSITEVWEELFGLAPIGARDNFFELGGHSLLATQVLNRLRGTLGRTVTLDRLLATPTVAGLAEQLRAAGTTEDEIDAVVPSPEHRYDPFPLTEMQQAQWIGRLSSFDMGGVAPHLYFEFDSRTLDVPRLERAWQRVVHRHDMLRMIVLPDGRQRVLPDTTPYRFTVLDLTEADPARAEDQLAAIRTRMAAEVRRADAWPLWEIRVSVLPERVVRVHISFDLLVADVSSFFYQLLPQWRDSYHEPDLELARPALTFRDYVLAEERLRATPRYERALEYWRARVRELPPAPELPTATTGVDDLARRTFVRRHATLDAELWGRIKSRAGEFGVTVSSAMLAAFAVAVGTWSKSQRFTLNFTAVNRLPVHEQVDDVVGEFASFDLLEVDAVAVSSFADLARDLQRQSWADFEHRFVSGVRILRERARARGGAGEAMPVVFTSALGNTLDGKPAESPVDWLGDQTYFVSQTPQVSIDHFLLEFEGNLELAWHAVDALFPDGMMAEMFRVYREFVVGLADAANWHRPPVLELPAWQLASRAAANATGGQLPDGVLTSRIFANATSTAPAVIAADRTLDYAELTARTATLARVLAEAGCGRGSVVGIGLAKGWRQIVAALAASAAGCVYVPLDPELPEERRRWLVDQAGIECVLTEPGTAGRWTGAPRVYEISEELCAPGPDTGFRCPAEPDDIAYVIYTSGSTGTPKGVAVSHRAALNTLVDIEQRFGLGPGDRVLALSALNFDLSVFDVFGILAVGGTVVVPAPEERRDPARWSELCRRHGVTTWNSVPALLQMLVEHLESTGDAAALAALRVTLLSGDWIPLSLPDRLRALAPGTQVISLGGATEAAVWSIAYPIGEVDPEWSSIPYGRPLRNQRFHVYDERLRPAPVWVPGQLYIAGSGLAECYWNDPTRTAESFLVHPETGERLYRTGDLGRYLPDGTLEFLGRDDFQVKVGGYRIELGEIEHALTRHPEVVGAVASARGPRTQQRLVAHVVPARTPADETAFTAALRAFLATVLPSYMIPADVVLIAELPLSANGKVDRSALPEPRHAGSAAPAEVELTPALRTLLTLAGELLGVDSIGPGDSFFRLGGDSIMGVRFVGRATAAGLAITPQQLFENASFAELAATAPGDIGVGETSEAVTLTAAQRFAGAQVGSVTFEVPDDFDPALAGRAWRALLDRHPALRGRVHLDEGQWFTPATDDPDDSAFPEIDLTALPEAVRAEALPDMVAEMTGEVDPRTGPIVKFAVVRCGEAGSVLVCAVAQALIDDSSVLTLCRELISAYRDLAAGREVTWTVAAGSLAAWTRGLRREPVHPDGLPTVGDVPRTLPGIHTTALDAARTADLFAVAAARYHLDPAEIIATAATVATARVLAEPPRVLLERSLRTDPARSGEPAEHLIGRVTEWAVLEPVAADAPPSVYLPELKRQLRAEHTRPARATTITVRELVRWDGTDDVLTPPQDFVGVDGVAPGNSVGQLSAALVGGALRVRWQFAAAVDTAEIACVAASFAATLDHIARHCREQSAGSYHPTDFPLAGLSDDELDDFLHDLR
ncbi:non-ribosomal peptide synthetase/type I polyketide synthase [Nocardia sp. AG03]|uniref:non-ribosomal peptide synthetase/type I polyketide synthase n=1 Tax=Nocardia sp. AG03 TaxID=3025312 RepID=UPI0024188D60|nr:non-ribosomal peptide synthetase/type I polyketide synthase [Nocardia sp. AG03]